MRMLQFQIVVIRISYDVIQMLDYFYKILHRNLNFFVIKHTSEIKVLFSRRSRLSHAKSRRAASIPSVLQAYLPCYKHTVRSGGEGALLEQHSDRLEEFEERQEKKRMSRQKSAQGTKERTRNKRAPAGSRWDSGDVF